MSDDDPTADVRNLMKRYHNALAPGSMLALSHASSDGLPDHTVDRAIDLFEQDGITVMSRNRKE
jgi:hypothetical protein